MAINSVPIEIKQDADLLIRLVNEATHKARQQIELASNKKMEKILIAIDSHRMDVHAVNFACYLANLTDSSLTGIFLNNTPQQMLAPTELESGSEKAGTFINEAAWSLYAEEESPRSNMIRFSNIANERAVNFNMLREDGVPGEALAAETRYADILVMDAGTSFSGRPETTPSQFVEEILQVSECPVIIAPDRFEGIDSILFCFNTGKSSAYAIKQFTYLFPEYSNKKMKVLLLNKDEEWDEDDLNALMEWLQDHYDDVEIIPADANNADSNWKFLEIRHTDMIVMGAYGKGLLRAFFEDQWKGNQLFSSHAPVFIAHY